mmetsp:Transcript_6719/g.11278  ORF Transcript_6719/g.11278 Transcript_6719/m.11278 type:complete len:166 (-) Transcript_6719:1084-1581(-)|eukprot:CAMPEP_0168610048 /NCGR_PEP_ID=MMETSP0449_2-20121227/1556_1 /TAXON_ID=1082188 /ORGANISM="Strombidium rassoulzadegani, Strain ras09" /LENGTH=165 /DNA_ID=CAMNT_0008650281 /DNA_START=1142 /DNA_END=1639 /DNA_ORIENTATION=+
MESKYEQLNIQAQFRLPWLSHETMHHLLANLHLMGQGAELPAPPATGSRVKYFNLADLFDTNTLETLGEVEQFLADIGSQELFWTRDILLLLLQPANQKAYQPRMLQQCIEIFVKRHEALLDQLDKEAFILNFKRNQREVPADFEQPDLELLGLNEAPNALSLQY